MFELNDLEWQNLRSNFASSNWGGIRYKPFAFTEHGVAMLASVLKSETAVQINIAIVRAFISIRRSLVQKPEEKITELQNSIKELNAFINDVLTDQNDINEDTRMQIELINQTFAELQVDKNNRDKPRRKVGFITNE